MSWFKNKFIVRANQNASQLLNFAEVMLALHIMLFESSVLPELDLGCTQEFDLFFINSWDQTALELTTAKILGFPVFSMYPVAKIILYLSCLNF